MKFEASEFASDDSTFKCPRHVCLECWLEDPQSPRCRSGKLVQCLKCPVAYHAGDFCVPAGSRDLGGSNIICAAHSREKKENSSSSTSHVNVGFCFACSDGGDLLCCDSCPAAFHKECLSNPVEPDSNANWFCDQCVVGKKPRYGELVWAKVGAQRWWPAEICHPKNLPEDNETTRTWKEGVKVGPRALIFIYE